MSLTKTWMHSVLREQGESNTIRKIRFRLLVGNLFVRLCQYSVPHNNHFLALNLTTSFICTQATLSVPINGLSQRATATAGLLYTSLAPDPPDPVDRVYFTYAALYRGYSTWMCKSSPDVNLYVNNRAYSSSFDATEPSTSMYDLMGEVLTIADEPELYAL